MIDMPSSLSAGVKRAANYSNCPLKKRPIKYEIDDTDSDHSSTNDLTTSVPMDISEPENLSTKPQDLRIKSSSSTKQIPIKPSPISPPPIGLVAGTRGSPTGSISSGYSLSPFGSTPPYSPNSYNNNNNLSSLGNGSMTTKMSGPLEPINLNPPAVYLPHHVSSYLPFNYHHHPSHPRNQPHFFPSLSPSHYPAFPPTSSANAAGSSPPHIPPFSLSHHHHQRIDLVGNSPPHMSPPIKQEPAYPILKSEDRMYNPRLVSPNGENSHPNTMKALHHAYSTRDTVISHSNSSSSSSSQQTVVPFPSYSVHHHHHHRDSMSSGRSSSCDSGISSPTGSSTASISSINSTSTNGSSGSLSGSGSTRYQCEHCNKSYSTYSGLTKHVQFHCASQNKKSFICKVCDKVYVSLGALKMHIRTHTLPCKCTLCGKAFSRPWLLQGHIRTHTGEKPFACNHCNRAFADRSNLRAHLQTHSEVKKYSCKSCSKTFSRMSLLVKHEDSGCNSSPVLSN